MPSADPHAATPFSTLFRHNQWAIRILIDRCRTLSSDQFHQRFNIGPGSLHDTISHMIGAMRRWCDRIAGKELRPPSDAAATKHTPDDLVRMLDEATTDLLAACRRVETGAPSAPLTMRIKRAGYPEQFNFAASDALLQLATHGFYHRAQCVNMFKQLGQPLDREIDIIEWRVVGDGT